MSTLEEIDLAEHERVLADAIVDVATELRLADPTEFILLVRGEQEANISDLVNSSSELFFKKGALRYGLAADCALGWAATPSVCLDMEFRYESVTAFFRLTIGAQRAAVEVMEVMVDEEAAGAESAEQLRRAVGGGAAFMSPREPPTIDAVAAGTNENLWRKLVQHGRAAYRAEARGATRQTTRLQSAKVLDGSGGFLCEAIIKDRSATGLRLLLARNCGLPARFGLHIDLTGELVTATPAWRRERLVGARIVTRAPPAPIKQTDRVALAGRYYAVPNS